MEIMPGHAKRDSLLNWVASRPDPDAILTNSEHTLSVHHYKGPTWEAAHGSIVSSDGKLARHFLPELPAQGPTRQFRKVTFVHRIDPSGGLPPFRYHPLSPTTHPLPPT